MGKTILHLLKEMMEAVRRQFLFVVPVLVETEIAPKWKEK
jgi:hypothetical protein